MTHDNLCPGFGASVRRWCENDRWQFVIVTVQSCSNLRVWGSIVLVVDKHMCCFQGLIPAGGKAAREVTGHVERRKKKRRGDLLCEMRRCLRAPVLNGFGKCCQLYVAVRRQARLGSAGQASQELITRDNNISWAGVISPGSSTAPYYRVIRETKHRNQLMPTGSEGRTCASG
jgi:hypothetical protein